MNVFVTCTGHTLEEHLTNIEAVFARFRAQVAPAKCAFLQKEVLYLGHIITEKGVAADPAKTQEVACWPTPKSAREVQQFLGLANYYRRFISDFDTIAKPLHRLTERNTSFNWTIECQEAFDHLRHRLTTAPVLAFPDYSKPFILDTDASDTGIGAVLSQLDDDGRGCVIAYGSRLLTKAERRYCVTRRELLVFTRPTC